MSTGTHTRSTSIGTRYSRTLQTLTNKSIVDIDEDRRRVKQRLFAYRLFYNVLGVFVGTYPILQQCFDGYIEYHYNQLSMNSYFILLVKIYMFAAPFLLKPLFGLIADTFYPCYYRFKFYVLGVGLLNGTAILSFWALDPEINMMTLMGITFTYMLSVVFIDSLAQGITTATCQLQAREYNLKRDIVSGDASAESGTTVDRSIGGSKNNAKIKDYAINYAFFSIITGAMRTTGMYINQIFKSLTPERSTEIEKKRFFKALWILLLFSVPMIIVFLFVNEMKKERLVNSQSRPSIKSVFRRVFKGEGTIIVVVTLLIVANPANYNYVPALRIISDRLFNDTDDEAIKSIYSSQLFAGGAVVLLLIIYAKYLQKLKYTFYFVLLITMQTLSSVSMYTLKYAIIGQTASKPSLFFAIIFVQMVAYLLSHGFSMVMIVSNLSDRAPPKYEVFFTNFVTSFIPLGYIFAQIFNTVLRNVIGVTENDCSNLDLFSYYTLFYTVFTALVYLVWRAVSRDTSKN